MSLNPELQTLYDNPDVQKVINIARSESEYRYTDTTLSWGGEARVRREGHYPLYTQEGKFTATLVRVTPYMDQGLHIRGGHRNHQNDIRGAEYRIVDNEHQWEMNESGVRIVFESIPLFLKELGFDGIRHRLSETREEIANDTKPSFLVQTRASDAHDGEYRNTESGQLDIKEEIWYAQVLQIMKLTGKDFAESKVIAARYGAHPFLIDYGLPQEAVMMYFFSLPLSGDDVSERIPLNMDFNVVTGSEFIESFKKSEHDDRFISNAAIREALQKATEARQMRLRLASGVFDAETLATYPIMREGVEYSCRLIKIQEKDAPTFTTFRVVTKGAINEYVRIDSICTNGVQGGDTHCDCLQQALQEFKRAGESKEGVTFISVRDHEGRNHGEAMKGGTLTVQRMLEAQGLARIGNAQASQLFYHETGLSVDARSFTTTQALLRYLGISSIRHLVTNNSNKEEAVREVCTVEESISAETHNPSEEASRTISEKARGDVPGVHYHYPRT